MTSRNKMKLWVLVSIILTFSSVGSAYAYTTYGSGTSSCGYWVKWRKTESGWYQDGQWVNGFISAYGHYGDYELKEVDPNAILLFMDNFCQQNPLSTISDGAQALVEELIMKN